MQLAQLCEQHTARLYDWISRAGSEPSLTRTRYDGSVKSACRVYQEHPLSGFQKVKHNTRKTYEQSLSIIERTVGARLIRNVTVLDVQRWYDEWRKGATLVDKQGRKSIGPERIDRAHDAISMFRTVVRFMAALRKPECKLLADEMKVIKFEKGGAREQELTYGHVTAFIQTALDLGQRRVMPYDRALHLAIATAAQFELMVRQKDIIGDWAPRRAERRYPVGISILHTDDETWTGYFTWENIPGWRWHVKTSKSKYRSGASFDLSQFTLLHPLLQLVPEGSARTGAIIKGEGGLPVRYRSFSKWWRQIARAARIPDDVESMDARAGGATEAEEAGATLEAIQGALTHSKKETTLRYIRHRSKKIADVAAARSVKRAAENGGGTT